MTFNDSINTLSTFVSRGIAPKYTEDTEGSIVVLNQKCVRDFKISLKPTRRSNLALRKVPDDKLLKKYDVVINSTGVGTLGRVAQYMGDLVQATVDSHVTIVRPDCEIIDPLYFGYLIKAKQAIIETLASGSTGQTELSRDAIKELTVDFVEDMDKQKKIGLMLLALDKKIDLNRQINQTLESMAQAIFKSWFVNFEPVKAKIAALEAGEDVEGVTRAAMRAISGKTDDEIDQMQAGQPENYAQLKTTAGLFPAGMQDSELGGVPEGWEVMPFSKLASLDTTSVKPHKEPDKLWEHYSIPAFDVNEAPKFEFGSEIKSNKYKVNPTAILSSKLNPNTPRTWWPDVDDETSAICSTEFMQFVPTDMVQRAFMFGLITSEIFQSGIKQRVTGSTGSRQRAQPSAVAEIDIVKPNEELILTYCSRLTELSVLKAKNIKENITLAQLRDTLLPKLMSGDILVKTER